MIHPHGTQRMNPDFCDSLIFPPAAFPQLIFFYYSVEYVNIYQLDWHKIRHLCFSQD